MKSVTHKLFIIFFCSSIFYSAAAFSDAKKDLVVKAAFMIKLTHFIQWKTSTTTLQDKENFTICINSSHQLSDILSKWALTGLIKNKSVAIKYLEYDSSQLSSCNMLYISNNDNLDFLLNQAKRNQIFTVSNAPGNAKRGVLINFVNIEGKLRFEINLDAAKESGFIISPRLLKLATIVSSNEAIK